MSSRERHGAAPDDPSLSALYRATRQEEPGDSLDRAVLEEARRAMSRKRRRWLLPLSTAAVILLGVSLTLTQFGPPTLYSPSPEADGRSRIPQPAPATPDREASEQVEARRLAPRLQKAVPSVGRARDEGVLLEDALEAPAGQSSKPASDAGWGETGDAAARIVHLRDLLRRGELAKLKAELAAFRKIYPDHPLPPELQAVEQPRP